MNNDAVHDEEITKNKIIRKSVIFKFSRSCCIDTKKNKQNRVVLADQDGVDSDGGDEDIEV